MSRTFLFIDHNSIWKNPHAPPGKKEAFPIANISLWQGIKLLFQPWKHYLHQTMGRPIIMRWRAKDE